MTESHDEPGTEAAELRALLRQAHETIKDLRRETREARSLASATRSDVEAEYRTLLGEACHALGEELRNWLKYATDRCPLAIACPGCGQMLAVLYEPGKPIVCNACGKRILAKIDRSKLPEATPESPAHAPLHDAAPSCCSAHAAQAAAR